MDRKQMGAADEKKTGWRHRGTGDGEFGPFTLNEMRREIEEGRVGPDTLVFNFYFGVWQPCEKIAQFKEAFHPVPVRPPAELAADGRPGERASADPASSPQALPLEGKIQPEKEPPVKPASRFKSRPGAVLKATGAAVLLGAVAWFSVRAFTARNAATGTVNFGSLKAEVQSMDSGAFFRRREALEPTMDLPLEGPGDPSLDAWAGSADAETRAYAAYRMREALSPPDGDISPLLTLAGDPSPLARGSAFLSLRFFSDEDGWEALDKGLDDPDAPAAIGAAAALTMAGDEASIGAVLSRLDRPAESGLKKVLIDLLLEAGVDPALRPDLAWAYDRSLKAVKVPARPRIEAPTPIEYDRWSASIEAGYAQDVLQTLARIEKTNDPQCQPLLAAALESGEPEVREAAVQAMKQVGEEEGIEILLGAAGDRDPREAESYYEAADGIRFRIVERRVVDWERFHSPPRSSEWSGVLRAAAGPDPQGRFEAAHRLGLAPQSPTAFDALRRAFDLGPAPVRLLALRAMGRYDGREPEYLVDALKSDSLPCLREAIRLARNAGNADWASPLRELAGVYGDTGLGDEAAQAADALDRSAP